MDTLLKRRISQFLERESKLMKKFIPRIVILEWIIWWFSATELWVIIVLSAITALILFMVSSALHNGSQELIKRRD